MTSTAAMLNVGPRQPETRRAATPTCNQTGCHANLTHGSRHHFRHHHRCPRAQRAPPRCQSSAATQCQPRSMTGAMAGHTTVPRKDPGPNWAHTQWPWPPNAPEHDGGNAKLDEEIHAFETVHDHCTLLTTQIDRNLASSAAVAATTVTPCKKGNTLLANAWYHHHSDDSNCLAK